ncbi:MAG: phosphoribosylaminoimidazolesuccinocarboxamide synthase [Steroidobacteraceae bacterium]
MTTPPAVHETRLSGLPLLHRGKVRDVYAIDDDSLLIVATDRLSAFDVVLPDPIPGKGCMLNSISNFWFARTGHIIPNHLLDRPLESIVPDAAERTPLQGRSVVARRLKALPVEAVVRGYLIGSGWKEYQATGGVCGIELPRRLRLAEKLPQILFTPATKAAVGDHDENISYGEVERLIGAGLAARVRDAAIALYRFAAEHAAARGIIIADTKFEFGLAPDGQLLLIDEALTPDSSRFWAAESYAVGSSPPSFDKQYVRDYLETLDWNKQAPGPRLPAQVIEHTAAKYAEALRRLTGPAAG